MVSKSSFVENLGVDIIAYDLMEYSWGCIYYIICYLYTIIYVILFISCHLYNISHRILLILEDHSYWKFVPHPLFVSLISQATRIQGIVNFRSIFFVSTTFWKSSRFWQGLILRCSHFGFLLPCDDLHPLVVRPDFVSAYPMYPNVSQCIVCALRAGTLCTSRSSLS